MNFIKSIFGKKDEPVRTYQDFWDWFQKHEKTFFTIVKSGNNIENDFFDKLSPKLSALNDGIFYLTGMKDEKTVELVLTPDGIIKNIVFVEELINAAPEIPGWKFTALKPAHDIQNLHIDMAGHTFDSDSLFFYSNEKPQYPDEIDITVVHSDYNEENKAVISNGVFIFLDNYLGELDFVNTIDHLTVSGKNEAAEELVPIEKLKDFLIWRQKEFTEKYEGERHNTENDNYSGLEAQLNDGKPLIAVVNTALLGWDRKASHPWILAVSVKYSSKNQNGMPDQPTYELLNELEDKVMNELKDLEGYLNIGRETADNVREIYFACKEFRKPSKVLHQLVKEYAGQLAVDFDIYKDKYWQSFDKYVQNGLWD